MNQQGNGHNPAWAESLFLEYRPRLVSYAMRLVRDAHRARDVVQDVFVQLCLAEEQTLKGREAAWLYTVCRRRSLDVCRKERRMNANMAAELQSCSDAAADPAVAAEQRENVSQLRRLVEQLPDNQHEVVRLKVEHGLKYREISEVTGLTVSNVGYLLHRAMRTLRDGMLSDPPDTSHR